MNTMHVAENFTVSEQIQLDDVSAIADAGYKVIVCNRPDREEPGQPNAAVIADACTALGLSFHHLPFQGMVLSAEIVESFRGIIEGANGPVFAYCRSGQRCAYLWANAMD